MDAAGNENTTGLADVDPNNSNARPVLEKRPSSHPRFLHVVKAVRLEQRMEKLNKAKSARPVARILGTGSDPRRAMSDARGRVVPEQQGLLQQETGLQTQDFKTQGGGLDEPPVETADGLVHQITTVQALIEIVCGKGLISALLLLAPVALVAVHYEWSATWIFWLNFFVMIPLAAILGDFTEEVALHTNQTIGGLINATFGNAVEVVVAIQALLANEIRVVQASMLGSIFSNLLLVLGCCFFFGGMYYKEQKFNTTAATANMGLLALSSIALVLPTPFAQYYDIHDEHVLAISRISAVFLMFMYVQLLVFQLKTHAHLFEGENEEELATLSMTVACIGLLTATLLVTIFSEYLVNSIEGFTAASGISRTFVGIIILPIVGNAVEHITAVTVAMKDKMDLAMGVAVGSCTQISLFVVPLTVIVGWIIERDMTLNFPIFEVSLFILAVFTVSVVLSNPKCNWLEGSLLMTTYFLIAVGFWFEKLESGN